MDKEKMENELKRCLGCKISFCQKGCPLGVSPHDFIKLALEGNYVEAQKVIREKNPLAETCGLVCPDSFCQKTCIRAKKDSAVAIPCLQAMICKKVPSEKLVLPSKNNKKIAIIGGGPAGLGACFELLKNGFSVVIFEKENKLGGAVRLIPDYRLPKDVLDKEIDYITKNDRVEVRLNSEVDNFVELEKEFDGVIIAVGEQDCRKLGIEGEEHSVQYKEVLLDVKAHCCQKVLVVGGGEVALDCAVSLKKNGAKEVYMAVRRRRDDMRIMKKDFEFLDANGIIIKDLCSVLKIKKNGESLDITIIKNEINEEGKARAIIGSDENWSGFDKVVIAMGADCSDLFKNLEMIKCGDMTGNAGTVVEAIASGVNGARLLMDKFKE